MSLLKKTLDSIRELDPTMADKAQERLDMLTKPQGSLGRLEEFARRYCVIRGQLEPSIRKKAIFTFAGDHGVSEEGVSAFPKEVTAQMVLNFVRGGAAINVIAKHVGADVIVIDIGVDHDFTEELNGANAFLKKKVARGTRNMTKGPAMTMDEALGAVHAGIEIAHEYADKGYDIFGTGDMGIANTTSSSAIVAAITGCSIESVTGRGTGIDDTSFHQKVAAIKTAIAVNRPDAGDALDVLVKVGGLEIAGIAGLIIGAASRRIPVVVDGFISTAGALIVTELEPRIKEYIFMAHKSVEIGHQVMLDRIGQKPFVDLNMRLGEGTGAAIGISLIECGTKIMTQMATFASAGVSEKTS